MTDVVLMKHLSTILSSNSTYVKIKTILFHSAYDIYTNFFFNPKYGGFSPQPDILHEEMLNYRTRMEEMFNNAEISESDMCALYPMSGETNLHDCSLDLLHKLVEVCFGPPSTISNESIDYCEQDLNRYAIEKECNREIDIENKTSFTNELLENKNNPCTEESLEEPPKETSTLNFKISTSDFNSLLQLQKLLNDRDLRKFLKECSAFDLDMKWSEVFALLTRLRYDINRVFFARNANTIELCWDVHEAYLRTIIELLLEECNKMIGSVHLQLVAIDQLKMNLVRSFRSNTSLSSSRVLDSITEDFNELKSSVNLSVNELVIIKNTIENALKGLSNWRMDNIEGDLILVELQLCRIGERVTCDALRVQDFFANIGNAIIRMQSASETSVHHGENDDESCSQGVDEDKASSVFSRLSFMSASKDK